MTMEMKGDDMDLLFQMGGMTMEMDGTYRSTRSAPETEPPAGDKVVDLWELLNTPSTSSEPLRAQSSIGAFSHSNQSGPRI